MSRVYLLLGDINLHLPGSFPGGIVLTKVTYLHTWCHHPWVGRWDEPNSSGSKSKPMVGRRATPSQEWSRAAPGASLGWELGAGGVSRIMVAQSQRGDKELRDPGRRSWKAGGLADVSSQGFEGQLAKEQLL